MDEEKKILKVAALKYNIQDDTAPKVVAKGSGELASNIIKIAKENNIPIKKDEDLVELLTKLDVNQQIPNNLYKAVAEVFAFIYDLSKQNKT
ncbi:EscU/YscU/HrcU family type III secretion system export apparatus switch protein [Arcobacter sp. F2176]|uniref:EscU/YscU/HrcU family type III secretion system export apparatus switch protein n=1 Tax=unclassified Arcobacter TaxID=2593671 RepID=UPI00100B4F8E|nr:EscU/YscU/HrcU family type III secretion system export apparatus switch protein [Arcobacter sp. F2176]RXJ80702.1 type III secretion system protein [Arcobacter sp. F2176]